jgi:hypothetical protein
VREKAIAREEKVIARGEREREREREREDLCFVLAMDMREEFLSSYYVI